MRQNTRGDQSHFFKLGLRFSSKIFESGSGNFSNWESDSCSDSSYQWWSLDTWSRSRDSSQYPFLRVSVSKVSGHETLNIAKKWFIKISKIQRFFVCCIFR